MVKDNNATKGKLLKIGQASNLLHVSTQTLRDWTEANKIHSVTSESGHRSYYEADVKKLALAEKGITTYWTANYIVALPANREKYYYLDPDTNKPATKPDLYETELNKFWNFTNGLQQQPHSVVLNDEAVIIEPGSTASYLGTPFALTLEETGNTLPLIAHYATVIGLNQDDVKALLPQALQQVITYLEDNYTAQQTVVWLDRNGQPVPE